jgi:hypothetical protein
MEGSGIADATWEYDRGYLVIRGICDYCDGNKGDLWQNYAALVAAAFTRALLESLPSDHFEGAPLTANKTTGTDRAAALEETLSLYTSKTYLEDQFARLDQAGEADADRTTLLQQVFVDLELTPRSGQQHLFIKSKTPRIRPKTSSRSDVHQTGDRRISALHCFLQELCPMIVVIGGPGHGKSTLGQYLAQIHRGLALGKPQLYTLGDDGDRRTRPSLKPKKVRLAFRIVLKFYAQWLSTRFNAISATRLPVTLESYLAEQVCEKTGREGEVSGRDIQDTLRNRPTLVILDGLDEVTEPELRRLVLTHVEGLLDRAKRMEADIQVIATSRPTEYTGEFDPKEFWHVELQPMQVERVRSYANKWVTVKVIAPDDQRRILETLEDCLREEHTKLLLTTPLQVTIVLLIIQGGGRPPSLREALFQEYWSTILRREKAKAKGVIRSDDQTLFDLHAYLGYVLHRRAAKQDVRSLLPRDEFQQVISTFLREKDKISDKDVIEERSRQLVREAAYRLVLLVEPEPDLFGFELRSLQEFFAAVYLAQTARDTAQRFARLKAIGRAPHWGNAALFFAGRIVRMFTGEAANILETVCRSIDRDPQDRFLRRGGWLSLDIAADSSFATSRDLQWGAIEFGLEVCEAVMATESHDRFSRALKRLPLDDRREILQPLLDKKLYEIPLISLPIVLGVYGELFGGATESFSKSLHRLAHSSMPDGHEQALQLALKSKYDEKWVARELDRNKAWARRQVAGAILTSFCEQPTYVSTVLHQWQPSEAKAAETIRGILSHGWLVDASWDHSSILPPIIQSPVDQLILSLTLMTLISTDTMRAYGGHSRINIPGHNVDLAAPQVGKPRRQGEPFVALAGRISEILELRHPEIPKPLRMLLWTVHFLLCDPTEKTASEFLTEIRDIERRDVESVSDLLRRLSRRWPLLAFHATKVLNNPQDVQPEILPFLNGDEQIQIGRELRTGIQMLVRRTRPEDWPWLSLRLQIGSIGNVPEVERIATQLSMPTDDVIKSHALFVAGDREQYPSKIVQWIFFEIRRSLRDSQTNLSSFWPALSPEWSFDEEVSAGGHQLMSDLLEATVRRSDLWSFTLTVYLKLLSKDDSMATFLRRVVTELGKAERTAEIGLFYFSNAPLLSLEHLQSLVTLAKDDNKHIKTGALVFLTTVIQSYMFFRRHFIAAELQKDTYVGTIDWQIGWNLASGNKVPERSRGVALLVRSNLSLADVGRKEALADLIHNAPVEDHAAWGEFIQSFQPASAAGEWTHFLETILLRPEDYPPDVIVAAMNRYTELVGSISTDPFQDSDALGLPN